MTSWAQARQPAPDPECKTDDQVARERGEVVCFACGVTLVPPSIHTCTLCARLQAKIAGDPDWRQATAKKIAEHA